MDRTQTDMRLGRKEGKAMVALFFAAGLAFPAVRSWAGNGGAPGQFVSYGAGARSMGMGKAFSAIADDASAAYWNPAAMIQLERRELQAMHVGLFQDTNLDSINLVMPTRRAGTLGFSMTRLVSGGFEKVAIKLDPTSQEIIKVDKLGTFSDVQQAYSLAYGKQFLENMSIGISAKSINHQLDTFTQSFYALDAAFFAKNLFKNHRLSFVAQNVVAQVSGDTDDRLPLTLRVGNAYSMLRDRINLAVDITQSNFSGMSWNFGSEYWVMRWASMRIGLEGRAGGIAETSAGMGVRYRNYSLDAAVALHDLGMSQRFSASWRFGRSVKTSQREEAKSFVEQGHELFRQGNYAQAVQKFNAALDMDPSNKDVQGMVTRLNDVVADLPVAPTGEVGRLVASGVKSYMDGDKEAAYDAFRSAFDKEPENSQLLNLTNRLAKLTGKQMVEAPKGAAAAARWTLVDQKLHDALQAIYQG
ncbi:MAG: PorV/PorQ family protein, partial [Elusimicrobia bacterium]|nr:PorV/PorQ family protein [Elusimicrobiota bacterium]